MLKPRYSSQFKKDFKLVVKRGYDTTLFVALIFMIPFFTLAGISPSPPPTNGLADSGICYIEILTAIDNPDRGFYRCIPIVAIPYGTPHIYDWQIEQSGHLIHLRIDLKAFGAASGGKDLTYDLLASLDASMDLIRQAGATAIIRFAYDWTGVWDYDSGHFNAYEPDINQVIKHVHQLTGFFHNNADIITVVESGFLGPWGEQHNTPIVTQENMNRLIDALLLAVPESRTISVRRPSFFANWAGIDINEIDQFTAAPGTPAHRVGIFNDGYMGSFNDLGTYINREKEIAWLSRQGRHTVFGGEVTKVDGLPNWNTYIFTEMFITNTSYLNINHHLDVIQMWRDTSYTGSNIHYHGVSEFDFINNHLGYRFVIRSSRLSSSVEQGGNLRITAAIENVGAGNVVNEQELVILFARDNEVIFYERSSFDVRHWNSGEISDISLDILLPSDVAEGRLRTYFKIAQPNQAIDNNLRTIQFANIGVWNQYFGANFMGEFDVLPCVAVPTPSPVPPISNIPGNVTRSGRVTAADVAMLRAFLAGFDVNICLIAADVNADGRVTAADLALIRAYLAGFDVVLKGLEAGAD